MEIFESGLAPFRSRLSLSFRLLFCLTLSLSVSCGRGPSRIAAPEWDPEGMADKAMTDLDKDSDGLLSESELKSAPGLESCTKILDKDGNGQLSREEIEDRIKLYRESQTGLISFACVIKWQNKPLNGAEVKLVPEPFLGGMVEAATGKSSRDGSVFFKVPSAPVPGVAQVGMYTVEVTSSSVKIPSKYNTETTLGVEVSPVTVPGQSGPPVFNLRKGR